MTVDALTFAIRTARAAGDLLLDHFRWTGIHADSKADSSVVTEADLAADRLITGRILESYPEDAVLSEELDEQGPSAAASVWIIDPLDGTTNFSLGLPIWGVSVARVTDGLPEVAAVYFPLFGELYTARAGNGAFRNETPIRVQPFDRARPAAFFSCCTRTHRRYRVQIPFKTRILGSAAYSLCLVARGSALLAFEATPKIWDLAGGWLLVQEAGGMIGPLDGGTPFPFNRAARAAASYPTVAAASESLAAQARRQIQPRDQKLSG